MGTLKRCTYTQQHTIVDATTGEVKQEETTKNFYVPKEPPFFKMFCQDLGALFRLTEKETQCLYLLAQAMGYNNVIPLMSGYREYIMQTLGINNKRTFERTIKELKEKEMLIPVMNKKNRPMRGMYMLNPNYVAKGEWKDINRLRLSVTYDGTNRYINSELVLGDGSKLQTPLIATN